MESCSFRCTPSLTVPSPSTRTKPKPISHFPLTTTKFPLNRSYFLHSPRLLMAALKSPRGFGTSPKKNKTVKRKIHGGTNSNKDDDNDDDYDVPEEEEEGIIPEIVTNRMMNRIGLSVGIPLFIGLFFFPFFYYLKVGLKIDVPTWIPFIVSFFFFGSALLGVSYGIVSSSWDPMKEGSLLGWNEAKKNWPVFLQSLWGRSGK